MSDHLPNRAPDQHLDDRRDRSDATESLAERIARVQDEVADLTGGAADTLAPGSELVALGHVPAEVAREQMATTRAAALRKTAEIKALEAELRAQMEAQLAELKATMKPLLEQARVASEKVDTLNLYLGRDEQIVTLRDGEPAPADTPITVRQQVLSMDEETAAYASQGGIDARHIDVFDKWIVDPAHLDQVFPEPKGVVVLVPRARGRDYADPWLDAAMREHNSWSYFLIRNGDRLYRMSTDFVVGKNLIPTADEFTSLFTLRRYNHDTGEHDTIDILPGSREWDDAVARQDARQRHFMKTALILQGLIDRTTVFQPLPAAGVNLLRQATYDNGTAVLVRDAEAQLTDGRPDFYDWLRSLNANLRVGMRVLGVFNTAEFHDAGNARRPSSDNGWRGRPNNRITPTNADYPRNDVVHTLTGRKAITGVSGFTFKYDRRNSATRGTCTVMPHDRFVLPYDLVTVDDLRYYLASRRQRHAYEHMFPLMHAAIAAKEAEASAEAPFRVLLAGELVNADDTLTLDDATALVDDLVHWWKLTAKHHRPLNGAPAHESRAIRDIVAEHLARTGAAAAQAGDGDAEQAIVARLLDLDPTIMVIGRRRDGSYLAYAPQPRTYPCGNVGYPAVNVTQPEPLTDAEQKALREGIFSPPEKNSYLIPAVVAGNVWAVEYTVSKTGKSTKSRTWVAPGTRLDGARILHATDAWAGWDIHADTNAHLTDVEIDDAIAEILPEVRSLLAPIEPAILGVALRTDPDVYDPRARFEVHMIDPTAPDFGPFTVADRGHHRLNYASVAVPFTKTTRGVQLHRRTDDDPRAGAAWRLKWSDRTYSHAPVDQPWHYFWGGRACDAITVRTYPDAAAVAHEHTRLIDERNTRAQELHDQSRAAIAVVKRAWEQRAEAAAYARFLEDYADPALWAEHRKTLHLEAEIHPAGRGIPAELHEALFEFALTERPLAGHTVRTVIEAAGLSADNVKDDLVDLPVA